MDSQGIVKHLEFRWKLCNGVALYQANEMLATDKIALLLYVLILLAVGYRLCVYCAIRYKILRVY